MTRPRSRDRTFLRASGFVAVAAAGLLSYLVFAGIAEEHGLSRLPTALFVAGAAVVGSVLNQPFRADPGVPQTAYPWLYLVWKASVAVAFACVLYLIFMGGLLRGGLFPEFRGAGTMFRDVESFVLLVHPASNADFAKLMVWSFIAGFSEKFVPNLISQLAGSTPRGPRSAEGTSLDATAAAGEDTDGQS